MRFHDAVLIFLSSGSLAFRLIVNNSLTRVPFDLSDMRPPRGSKKLNELLSLEVNLKYASMFPASLSCFLWLFLTQVYCFGRSP